MMTRVLVKSYSKFLRNINNVYLRHKYEDTVFLETFCQIQRRHKSGETEL
jgi:hypothetical protein